MTKKELADVLHLTPRQVDNLVVDGIPRRKAGRSWAYDVVAVVWYFSRKLEAAQAARPPKLDEARARFELARAELAEYELAEKRAETLTVAVHLALLGDYLQRVRARHLALPGKWAPRLVNLRSTEAAQLRAKELVNDVLLELTRIGEEVEGSGDDDHDAPDGAAPRPARRRRRVSRAARPAPRPHRQ
jgi:phage terminase Nu1 subunit (DNA packaging protein)